MKQIQQRLFIFLLLSLISLKGLSQKSRPAVLDSTIEVYKTSIYFDTDRSEIPSTQLDALIAISYQVKLNTDAEIIITGHADQIGASDYNLALSMKRAQAVKTRLIQLDTNCREAKMEYFGEHIPKVIGNEISSLQENRRVDVTVELARKFIQLTGKVINEEALPVVGARVKIKSPSHFGETLTDNLGEFEIYSPAGEDVDISVLAKDHFYLSRKVSVAEALKLRKRNMILPTLEMNKKYVANQLFFHGGKSILLRSSFDELERIESTMKINENYCFEIAGHINRPNVLDAPRESANFRLSVARALTVHDSLRNSGVDQRRIFARGYGNWQMLFPKADTKERMQANRRVEIIVRACPTVHQLKNDTITNRDEFGFDPTKVKLTKLLRAYDLLLFNQDERAVILVHIRHLLSIHHDIYGYTFQQLLDEEIIPEHMLNIN